VQSSTEAAPEWGTKHAAGCYYGSGLYAIWYAVRSCPEPHPRAKDWDHTPGRGFDANGIKWCERACPRCGFAEAPDYLHRLSIEGQGCFAGASGDILQALEEPEDPGHQYRVARMIRMSPLPGGPPSYCAIVGCRNWRGEGWVCGEHKHAALCPECNWPTGQQFFVEGKCVGCFHLKLETPEPDEQ